MKHPIAMLLLAAGCLTFAASAHSQSLAELAKKEKARRAANRENGKSKEVAVVDDFALRNAEASNYTAVEVTGAPERAEPAAIGNPAPDNPNRPQPADSSNSTRTTPSTTPSPKTANTELGKGWSTNHDNTKPLRPAPPGTQPMHPTRYGYDAQGRRVPIY